jgi:hypothetical protein
MGGLQRTLVAIASLLPMAALADPSAPGQRVQSAHGTPWRAQCSPEHRRLFELELRALRRLDELALGDGDKLCAALKADDQVDVSKLIDPKLLDAWLSDRQRQLLRALGVDIAKLDVAKVMSLLGIAAPRLDLRTLQQQCRQAQGGIERFTRERRERLQGELLRCEDRV